MPTTPEVSFNYAGGILRPSHRFVQSDPFYSKFHLFRAPSTYTCNQFCLESTSLAQILSVWPGHSVGHVSIYIICLESVCLLLPPPPVYSRALHLQQCHSFSSQLHFIWPAVPPSSLIWNRSDEVILPRGYLWNGSVSEFWNWSQVQTSVLCPPIAVATEVLYIFVEIL